MLDSIGSCLGVVVAVGVAELVVGQQREWACLVAVVVAVAAVSDCRRPKSCGADFGRRSFVVVAAAAVGSASTESALVCWRSRWLVHYLWPPSEETYLQFE